MSPVGEAGVVLVPVHLQSILYRERDDKRYVYMMSSEGGREENEEEYREHTLFVRQDTPIKYTQELISVNQRQLDQL